VKTEKNKRMLQLLIMLTRMQFCGRQNTALRPWRTRNWRRRFPSHDHAT